MVTQRPQRDTARLGHQVLRHDGAECAVHWTYVPEGSLLLAAATHVKYCGWDCGCIRLSRAPSTDSADYRSCPYLSIASVCSQFPQLPLICYGFLQFTRSSWKEGKKFGSQTTASLLKERSRLNLPPAKASLPTNSGRAKWNALSVVRPLALSWL